MTNYDQANPQSGLFYLSGWKYLEKNSIVKKGDNSTYLSSHKDRFFRRCAYLGQRLTATTFGELVYSVYHESYAGVNNFR